MNKHFREVILKATGATDLFEVNKIQDLWSGYGVIMRYGLKGGELPTVVLKHVKWPTAKNHPRGWNTNLSHKRKVRSYSVETNWYSQWHMTCDDRCRVPECLVLEKHNDEIIIVLEDLDSIGFDVRRQSVSLAEMKLCLSWLAHFHAAFLGKHPEGLWKVGTYWHLDTRPEELDVLDDQELKHAARAIDRKLKQSKFQTFVHGDAKLANFCFDRKGRNIAALDFQYVGGGCGMKDVAYFIGSCLYEEQCEKHAGALLDSYFSALKAATLEKNKGINFDVLEKDWRDLYPVAWTDFHRFIKGWSPGHWKINSYSERLAKEVMASL
ncbi:MAG: phosphotransferase [bacterium]|nr:phosphotransferase [bacterium]